MRHTRRRLRRLPIWPLATVAAVVAGERVLARTARRWADAHDPSGGEPLALPPLVESEVTSTDGARLAVGVAGPPDATSTYVLSHCWTGDRRTWAPVVRRLAADARVVIYDQRGHGRSTVGRAGITLDALGDDVRAVLEHVDARGAVLAGHSMGGMSVLSFAVRHSDVLRERVAALGLVATACDRARRSPAGLLLRPTLVGPAIERSMRHPRVGPLLVRGTVGRHAVQGHLDAVVETFLATAATTRADCLRAIATLDLAQAVRTVDLPATVLVGTRDLLTPVAAARRIAAGLAGARLVVLPDVGHMLPSEAPDEVEAALRELADRSASTAPASAGAPS